jgi:phosphoglycerate dehydrogenase-like enzyme
MDSGVASISVMTAAAPPHVLSLTPRAVLEPVHEALRATLAAHTLTFLAEAPAGLAEGEFIVGDWTHATGLDAAQLAVARRCRCVFQPAAGVEEIDVAAAATLGIAVANTPGANDVAVAEWVVMAALAALKDAWRHHEGVRAGRWDMVAAGEEGVYELAGRTVGIVGLGRIGQSVAQRLAGFDVGRLLYADAVAASAGVERSLGLERVELDALCAASDVVTLHVPLTETTRGLIGARRLALMPRGAVVINAARGAVLDEDALAAALAARHLKGAALDVFTTEPPPADHPLRDRADVLLSPHLAGSTNEARERMIAGALRNLDGVLRGGAPAHVVNGVAFRPRSG